MKNWQLVIKQWILDTLGKEQFESTEERRKRFLEESLELCQACDMQKEEAHQLVDYVFNRPVGKLSQEIGGAFVTFLALCENQGEHALNCLIKEANRISTPEAKKKVQEASRRKRKDGVGI